MPPRKSRRRLEPPPQEKIAEDPNSIPKNPKNGGDPNASLPLVQLPPELFDAIIENYATLPSTFYYDTHSIPDLKYYERNDALTALSQTCTALRVITLPRLWARLDICRVPERARGTWYKYTMQAIERKANGIAVSPPDTALPALWAMLSKLPNLRTIQVVVCKTPGFAKSVADLKLELPNVTALFIPNEVSVLQRLCPNATHVRCAGGTGAALISALTDKTEVFDGMVDWKDLKLVDRLIKKAPNLRTLELRRPMNWGMPHTSQDTVPAEWNQVIPKLASLKKLAELILTFPAAEDKPGDAALIESARKLMRTDQSAVAGERRLVVRHIVARNYMNHEQDEDVMTSCTTETFESS
ncbi:hypothetical protein MVEN_00245300 [Mycena venus]|uniref:F-box domain-containing protein n=1 Tax=Mycena venus TaxID=2733690 RepID=A0A8H6Z2I2_9AGAR|nr:hypothetical protein MVEN_00245300 [Mycena venus]